MRKFSKGEKNNLSESLVKTVDLYMTSDQEIKKKLNCQCCGKRWNQIFKFLPVKF